MSAPHRIVERTGNGRYILKIDGRVAMCITHDAEHPIPWIIQDADGRFMGRVRRYELGSDFLAAWQAVEQKYRP